MSRFALVAAAAALALTGCSTAETAPAAPRNASGATASEAAPAAQTPSASPSSENPGASLPGYAPGQFPAVPLFTIPDVSVLDTAGTQLRDQMKPDLPDRPGITLTAVQCNASGEYAHAEAGLTLYGDGSGSYLGPDGSYVRDADGGESAVVGEESITRDGRGGGTYVGHGLSITNAGDGSGTYVQDEEGISITLDGQGGGTYVNDRTGDSITNDGDGSGTYSNDTTGVSVTNDGDGSGTYTDGTYSIVNNGDGKAMVTSPTFSGSVDAEKLPPVPALGKFPPVEQLLPRTDVCGFLITLDAGILFDFDKDAVRQDASTVLDNLTDALSGISTREIQVSGHTDAIGSDSYNQGLSERRAAAVVAALRQRGVSTPLTAQGFGEARPVAPNEIDGVDNPAGRQLNRRVEVFVRA